MMSRLPFAFLIAGALAASTGIAVAAEGVTTAAWQRFRAQSADTLNALAHTTVAGALDEGAPAITLSFDQFFGAVGDEGLGFTSFIRSLAGKRVSVTGFMVRESRRQRGAFLLVQRPDTIQAEGRCVAVDLPPATVYVHAPAGPRPSPVPYVPGRITVTGTLEIGTRLEANGRNSWIRISLDHVPSFIHASGSTPATVDRP